MRYISPGLHILGYCIWHWGAGTIHEVRGNHGKAAAHFLLADEAAGLDPYVADPDVRGTALDPMLREMLARHRLDQARLMFNALRDVEEARGVDFSEALDVLGDALNDAHEHWSLVKASADRAKMEISLQRARKAMMST